MIKEKEIWEKILRNLEYLTQRDKKLNIIVRNRQIKMESKNELNKKKIIEDLLTGIEHNKENCCFYTDLLDYPQLRKTQKTIYLSTFSCTPRYLSIGLSCKYNITDLVSIEKNCNEIVIYRTDPRQSCGFELFIRNLRELKLSNNKLVRFLIDGNINNDEKRKLIFKLLE